MNGPNPFLSELFGTFDGGTDTTVNDDQVKVAEANLEEATLLGQAMAHAYVQELGEIEKQAGPKWDAVKGGASKAWNAIRGAAGWTFKPSRAGAAGGPRTGRWHEGARALKEAVTGKGSIGPGDMKLKDRAKALGYAAKQFGPELGAAGLGGGAAAYGLSRRGKKKKAEMDQAQFDYLAEKVAMGVLHENNINPYTLEAYESYQEKVAVEQYAAEQEKTAGYDDSDDSDDIENAIYGRAAEMLEAVGFEV